MEQKLFYFLIFFQEFVEIIRPKFIIFNYLKKSNNGGIVSVNLSFLSHIVFFSIIWFFISIMDLFVISIFLFPVSKWWIHLIKAYLSILRSSNSFLLFGRSLVIPVLSWLNHILRITLADVLLIRITLDCSWLWWLDFWHKRLDICTHLSNIFLFIFNLIFIHLRSWLIRWFLLDWIIFCLLLHMVSPV